MIRSKISVLSIGISLVFLERAEGRELFSPDRTEQVLRFVKNQLPENPIIVEAGSYDGHDTVLMAKLWPSARIFTFEPVESLYEKGKKNTASYPNVRSFRQALSDTIGTAVFYISEMDGNISASSSLFPPKQHLDFYPDILFPKTIAVETTTLDAFAERESLDHVDFLWLDMQGYELPMLEVSEIAKTATYIYTEVEFIEAYEGQPLYKEVRNRMESKGFRLIATDFTDEQTQEPIDPKRFWGNCLFVKEKTPGENK